MGLDASELLGAPQLAAVKVLPRGATMAKAWRQGGLSAGVIGIAGGEAASGRAAKKGKQAQADTPEFKGQALLALTDAEVALVGIKSGLTAKPSEIIARMPRQMVSEANLKDGMVPKLMINFSDGSAWTMDVPRIFKKQGDTLRIVGLLTG